HCFKTGKETVQARAILLADRIESRPSTEPEGDAQPRSGQPVRRSTARSRSGRQAQHRALSRRLHVPAQRRGVQELEITDCDFNLIVRPALRALREYRDV